MKRCRHCNVIKPYSEFFHDKGKKDGHGSWCKKCLKEGKHHWNTGSSFTDEQCKTMVDAYMCGMSLKEAASLCGTTRQLLAAVMKRDGVPEKEHACRTYGVDDHFFDVIDTEEKAYWLGFLSADGYVRGNQVAIHLAEIDRAHIEKFRSAIGAENPIMFKENGGVNKSVAINICSDEMAFALKSHGVVEGKTYTLKPATTVPEHLLRHYWRGCVDGDGCIYIGVDNRRGTKCPSITINFVGTEWITEGLGKFVSSHIKTCASSHRVKDSSLFQIGYCGRSTPKKVIGLLYSGASVYLDRKMAMAKRAMNIPNGIMGRKKYSKAVL